MKDLKKIFIALIILTLSTLDANSALIQKRELHGGKPRPDGQIGYKTVTETYNFLINKIICEGDGSIICPEFDNAITSVIQNIVEIAVSQGLSHGSGRYKNATYSWIDGNINKNDVLEYKYEVVLPDNE